MCSPGWAFAWEIWRGSRILLVLTLTYLLALVLLVNVCPAGTLDPEVIAILTIPLGCAGLPLWAVLSHTEHADLMACESAYPRRAFTLPLRTVALASWPMTLGVAAVAPYWLAVAGLVLRPGGLPVPVLWPAVFVAALLAWGQVVMWLPLPLPGLRILVAVPVLGGMMTGAALGSVYEVSPLMLLAVSAGLIPTGYLVAVVAVERARRGDTPVRSWPALLRRGATTAPPPFAAARAALFWLEWRRNGWTLPGLVLLILVSELLLLALAGGSGRPDMQPDGFLAAFQAGVFLVSLVLFPTLLAGGAGASLGNGHPWSRKVSTLPAFSAVRPVTSAAMIAVKLRVAARATLLTWGLAYLAILALLPLSPAGVVLERWARQLIDTQGLKGAVLLVLIVLGLPALTGKEFISQLWLGLTGRPWVPMAMAVVFPVGLIAMTLVGQWASNAEVEAALLAAVPWGIGLALLLKVGGGGLLAWALLRRGLVAPRTVLRFAGAWMVAAAVVFALCFWLVPPEVYSPLTAGGSAVLVLLPLVRLGLAPLALDWNRHR